jgi:prolyl 4-hydroxylase
LNPIGPDLSGSPLYLDAGDRRVALLAHWRDPLLLVLGSVLSVDECDELIALAQPRLHRSLTVQTDTGGDEINEVRTSDGMFFGQGENPLVQRIEARISTLLRWPATHGEGLQVLHYGPGTEYRPHYDFFDPAQPGTPAMLSRGGQRLGTFIMYLNEPEGGGATSFPDLGLEVMPHKGHGIFFAYNRPSAATRTLHAGAPVLAGDKWIATKWLREDVFE